jgi:hypothetical protein
MNKEPRDFKEGDKVIYIGETHVGETGEATIKQGETGFILFISDKDRFNNTSYAGVMFDGKKDWTAMYFHELKHKNEILKIKQWLKLF